jgi:hypothetical protein
MDSRPTVRVSPVTSHQLDRTITIGSQVGGCLISVMVRDGRLRIEVYRADDTVDVIAPAVGHAE